MAIWSVKTRPKPGSTSLAARSASDTGFAVGLISNFIAVLPAAEADAGLLAKETAMGILPGLARHPRPCLVGWASPAPVLRRVTTAARRQDTLLRDGEVQYVCRYAARQSHGRPICRPQPPSLAFSGRLKCSRQRNDIMFRSERAVL